MITRPITIRLVLLAIVSGIAAGALTALMFAAWGPSIPWILGGGQPPDSPNVVPLVVAAIVTSSIITDGPSRRHRRRTA